MLNLYSTKWVLYALQQVFGFICCFSLLFSSVSSASFHQFFHFFCSYTSMNFFIYSFFVLICKRSSSVYKLEKRILPVIHELSRAMREHVITGVWLVWLDAYLNHILINMGLVCYVSMLVVRSFWSSAQTNIRSISNSSTASSHMHLISLRHSRHLRTLDKRTLYIFMQCVFHFMRWHPSPKLLCFIYDMRFRLYAYRMPSVAHILEMPNGCMASSSNHCHQSPTENEVVTVLMPSSVLQRVYTWYYSWFFSVPWNNSPLGWASFGPIPLFHTTERVVVANILLQFKQWPWTPFDNQPTIRLPNFSFCSSLSTRNEHSNLLYVLWECARFPPVLQRAL